MLHNFDCDVYDLLDEAYALSLSIRPDVEKASKVLERLRQCAERADEQGLKEMRQQLLNAAADLEKRLAG